MYYHPLHHFNGCLLYQHHRNATPGYTDTTAVLQVFIATFSVAALLSVGFQWYIDEGNNLRLRASLPILRQSIWVRQDYVIMLIYVITGTTMKLRSRIPFKKTNQTKVVLSSTVANHLWAVYCAVGQ